MDRAEAETKLKKAIERAARLGWLKPHPTHGWTMCGADVEKTIMIALGDSQFEMDDYPVITTEEMCGLIMSSMWDREREKERRKHYYSDPRRFMREMREKRSNRR